MPILPKSACVNTWRDIGNYVLFGGGASSITNTATPYNNIDAYDKNLNRTTPTALSKSRLKLAATTVGNYALFAGGTDNSSSCSTVDAYDENLNHTTPTALSKSRFDLGGATTGKYALFAGGNTGATVSATTYTNVIDVYDQTLRRSNIDPLSENKEGVGAVTLGNHILFGGGHSGSGYFEVVEVYDI